jgi:hypothetical protein
MSIVYQDCPVTVKVGEKEFSKTYKQIVRSTLSVDDILTMLTDADEKAQKSVINDWHYGQDLRAKADTRTTILDEVAGPEKSFEKSVKQFMDLRSKAGKPVTEEQARKVVKAQMEMEVE